MAAAAAARCPWVPLCRQEQSRACLGLLLSGALCTSGWFCLSPEHANAAILCAVHVHAWALANCPCSSLLCRSMTPGRGFSMTRWHRHLLHARLMVYWCMMPLSVQVYAPRKGLYDQMTHATGDWDSWSPDNGELMLTQGEQISSSSSCSSSSTNSSNCSGGSSSRYTWGSSWSPAREDSCRHRACWLTHLPISWTGACAAPQAGTTASDLVAGPAAH